MMPGQVIFQELGLDPAQISHEQRHLMDSPSYRQSWEDRQWAEDHIAYPWMVDANPDAIDNGMERRKAAP